MDPLKEPKGFSRSHHGGSHHGGKTRRLQPSLVRQQNLVKLNSTPIQPNVKAINLIPIVIKATVRGPRRWLRPQTS
ncbi:unnamed protein product [Linum trigynum]|uniref:Uncharacterized protein n=1 Tax=Linum trigynum TaxID=586398 RepID=A0AAV2DEH4_9ROSI